MPDSDATTGASPRRRPGRWRTGEQSRQRILDAARASFATAGYDRATVRAIAAAAGADPAMVSYFFGGKRELFVSAMQLAGDPGDSLPRLIDAGLEGLGARLVRRVLQVWDGAEGPDAVLPLLRSAGASEESAAMVREFVQREIADRLIGALDAPDAHMRVGLVCAQLMGLAAARYQVRLEPIASASQETVVAWLGPVLQRCLTGPTPEAGRVP
jgi:AcrR family transcriptional regulator